MKLSVKAAKAFCKANDIKNLDIRSTTSIRLLIRADKKLYRIPATDIDTSKTGLFKAAELVKEYKQLAKYNFNKFLLLTSATNRLDKFDMANYINTFLEIKRHKLASCTYKNYVRKIRKHIKPKFESVCVTEISPLDIEKWVAIELAYLSDKTIKELVSLLSQIITIAQLEGVIDKHPIASLTTSRVLKLKASLSQPDPFTQPEIRRIALTETPRKSEQNMVLFNCYAGLRLSELMALAWEDIDFDRNIIHVQRAVVERDYKTPKTESSIRIVELLPKAREILMRQKMLRPSPISNISVTQPDNRSQKQQEVTFVFFDSRTGLALSHDNQFRNVTYKKLLVKSGVRVRGINQTRHTYASHLISAGLPLAWVARQMGHNSIKMIEKHYSKWLLTNNEDMLAMASSAF
ncbi:tyrosine-type recombinase/integrase [Alteromonas genovensis]|uniref:Tyrosine-type recombinase/integrase n=1 Tax=Alteromonas genovensis TaxID=471225 RepID=A0A6N9TGZ5_9ALTE|nr:site-specific integrase [Alteromonas genovensis]NDW15186.1 tyrosine-type recombinase/integrase [Alteromonas genovensis]